ncbi:MAG TPA: glycosyltransferase family 39 protein [Bacteroidota bacterium]|nr:glycosyltransferase family 39 protein [Bacteroidota bacterium]
MVKRIFTGFKERLLIWIDRSPHAVLLALILALVAFDGYYVWHSRHHASGFTGMSWDIAESLRKGEGYSFIAPSYFPFSGATNKTSAAREPVPVLLFVAVGALFNGSYLALGAFHILVRILTLLGIFTLARQIAGVRVAVLAAIGWLVYLPALREVPAKEVDLIAALFTVWGLALAVRAWSADRMVWWFASGIMLGLATLTRSALLAVALAITVCLFLFRKDSQGSRRLRPILLFVGAIAAVQLPWVVRNVAAFGQPVIGTTLAGYNLYRQNHMLEEGKLVPFVAGPATQQSLQALIARHPELTGIENEAEFDRFLREESFRIIAAHPGGYVLLCLYRFPALWLNWGVPEAYGNSPNTTDYLMMIQQALLLVLAFTTGTLELWEKSWPIIAGVVAFTLIHMAVAARMLYTIDVVPSLLPLASVSILSVSARHRWASVMLPTSGVAWVLYAVLVDLGRLPPPSS